MVNTHAFVLVASDDLQPYLGHGRRPLGGRRLPHCCIRLVPAVSCAAGTNACACMAGWLDMPCVNKSGGVDKGSVWACPSHVTNPDTTPSLHPVVTPPLCNYPQGVGYPIPG